MARLPNPGGDDGQWGTILNDFLSVEHNADGTLKRSAEIATKYRKPAGGIPATDMSAAVQTLLNAPQAATPANGSIIDSQIAPNAAIAQSKVSGLTVALANKVSTTDPRLTGPRLTVMQGTSTVGTRANLNILPGYFVTPTVTDTGATTDSIDLQYTAATAFAAGSSALTNVRDYGATGNGTTDDTAAFNAALTDIASTGSIATLYVPAGTYRLSSSLSVSGARLLGDGPNVSTLHWGSDLGTSTTNIYGLDMQPVGAGTAPYGTSVQSLSLQGPGGAKQLGVRQVWMHGLKPGTNTIVRDTQISGFNGGIYLNSSQEQIENVVASNNYYGVYYGSGAAGQGQSYLHCDFTGNAYASFGLHPASDPRGLLLMACQLGGSPYGFFREGPYAAGHDSFLSTAVFTQCRFDSCGNGIFFAADTSSGAALDGLVLTSVIVSNPFAVAQQLGGQPRDALVVCGPMSRWRVWGRNDFSVPGTLAAIKAGQVQQVYFDASDDALNTCNAAAKPWLLASSLQDVELFYAGGRIKAFAANGALQSGFLVQADVNQSCRQYTTGIPVGVAVMAASAGGVAWVAMAGDVSVKVAVAGSIAAGQYLKADTANANCVAAASGPSDGAVVGISTAADSGGYVSARLTRLN